jgi:hypothetical protein
MRSFPFDRSNTNFGVTFSPMTIAREMGETERKCTSTLALRRQAMLFCIYVF